MYSSCYLYPESRVISNQVIHYTLITNTNVATCFRLFLLRLRGLIGSSIYSAPIQTSSRIRVPVFPNRSPQKKFPFNAALGDLKTALDCRLWKVNQTCLGSMAIHFA